MLGDKGICPDFGDGAVGGAQGSLDGLAVELQPQAPILTAGPL